MNTDLVVFELMTLLVPFALIVLLFFVVRGAVRGGVRDAMSAGDSRERAGGEPSAREVLDRRYASGGVDEGGISEYSR